MSIALLHLSLIEGVGPVTAQLILEVSQKKGIIFDQWYLFSASEWMQIFGLKERTSLLIKKGFSDTKILEKELFLIEKNGVQLTTCLDKEYPLLLKYIVAPPVVLYWKGSFSFCDQHSIAIVGSRKADTYGKKMVGILVKELVAQRFVIVSGGAIGLDTYAHQETLNQQGHTVVVLGSGLLSAYPAENKALFEKVAETGTLLSIFPLQSSAVPGNFPARNRVIAGLSKGCVVVQAAAKSGARITAQYALEQGRDVFAVPGRADDILSAGCNELIKMGAKLVQNAHDIIVEYIPKYQSNDISHNAVFCQTIQTDFLQKKQHTPFSLLSTQIVELCKKNAQSIDDLVAYTHFSLSEIQDILFDLQLEGHIVQTAAGHWIAH